MLYPELEACSWPALAACTRHLTVSLLSFPSLAQYIESPDVEKEVKRLLSTDAEAVSVRILLVGKKAQGWDRTCA